MEFLLGSNLRSRKELVYRNRDKGGKGGGYFKLYGMINVRFFGRMILSSITNKLFIFLLNVFFICK